MTGVDDPFDWQATADGGMLVFRGGRLVVRIGRDEAARLSRKLGRSDDEDQRLLAAATGNYRRGNERRT